MDGWANTNGSDLLLHEHSHRLGTREVKSLDMGCALLFLSAAGDMPRLPVEGQ